MKLSILFIFATTIYLANAACNLNCPSSLTRFVDDKCYYQIEDMRHLVTGDCSEISQSGLGGFFPEGSHTVTMTDTNDLQSCSFDVEVIDQTAPFIQGIRGNPNLLTGDHANNKWRDVHFHFNKRENCCYVFCNITGVTFEDSDAVCCGRRQCTDDDRRRGDDDCDDDDRRKRGVKRDDDDDDDDNHHSGKGQDCSRSHKQYEIIGSRTVRLCARNRHCKKRTYTVTGMCFDKNGLSSSKVTTVVSTKKVCNSPDPHCQRGIKKANVCCPDHCGVCGGVGCGARPGGAKDCCGGPIVASSKNCRHNPAPCIL